MERSLASRAPAFFIAGLCVAFLFYGAANAQMNKDDQKCVDKANNGLAKLCKTQAKENTACVKNATKGKQPDPEGCLSADLKGKVAKAKTKIIGCPAPNPIPIDKATAENAFVDEALELAHDLFGSDLNLAGLTTATKEEGKCAIAVIQKAGDILAEKAKAFRKCKKGGMKLGTITDPASLQATCLPESGIPDPKGKIAKRITKLGEAISKKCSVPLSGTQFDNGRCAGLAGAALRDCADERVECRVCNALNAADGLDADCDEFDDGILNGSCGGFPAIDIGNHECVLDPNSTLAFKTQDGPLTVYPVSGAIDINCGLTAPNGKAPCECIPQDLDPIEVPLFGYICLSSSPEACPVGEIDCDGGNALDVVMETDHNRGSCLDNAACEAECETYCTSIGADVLNADCEGFCQGGVNADLPCTQEDSECPGGYCAGWVDGHGNICNCDCVAVGGTPSGAGALQCNMGLEFHNEYDTPCGDGDIGIVLGSGCLTLTTQTVTSQIHNANNTPGNEFSDPPFTTSGAAVDCLDLATSTTTGLTLAGLGNLIDMSAGDMIRRQVFNCQ
jgi:hypothetical protein